MAASLTIICFLLISIIQFAISNEIDRNSVNSKQKIDDDQLIFSHTLCRHGDRNIFCSYPTDPWKSLDHWTDGGGFAKLTNAGRQQQFKLGQYFRTRYSSLLGDGNYSPNNIYVQSTDVDRVLKSAKANLAGLYSSAEHQEWNENIENHIPVPVHIVQRSDDYVLASEKRCDHFDYLMFEYMNSAEIRGLFKKYKSLIRYLEENSGKKLPSLTDINVLYDTLFIEQLKGKRLPSWADEVMTRGGDFEYLMHYYFQIFTQTPEMKKIKSGFLFKEILDRFTNKTLSILSPDRNLWLYFAHDITITNMLNSLGLFKLHQPPYSSCVIFELFQSDDNNYVQIFYKNSTSTDIPALEIPGCGTKCPLDRLYEIYHDILPTQSFEKECELREGETLPVNGNLENNSL